MTSNKFVVAEDGPAQKRYRISHRNKDAPNCCFLVTCDKDCLGCIWDCLALGDLLNIRSTCSSFREVLNKHYAENTPWEFSSSLCRHHDLGRSPNWWSLCGRGCFSKSASNYNCIPRSKITKSLLLAFQKLSPNLKSFELTRPMSQLLRSCNDIEDCQHYEEEVAYVRGYQKLRHLSVQTAKTPTACDALIRGMTHTLRNLRELEIMQLCVDLRALTSLALEKLLLAPSRFFDRSIQVMNLDVFLQKTPTLVSLFIEKGMFYPGLAESFQRAGKLDLEELGLNNCGSDCDSVSDEVIEEVCKNSNSLKVLEVSGDSRGGLTSAGLGMILKIAGLEAIDLSFHELDKLYVPISHNVPDLTTLKCLVACFCGSLGLENNGPQKSIFSILKKAPNLEKVDVRFTNITGGCLFSAWAGLKNLVDLSVTCVNASADIETLLRRRCLPRLRYLSCENISDDVKQANPEIFFRR